MIRLSALLVVLIFGLGSALAQQPESQPAPSNSADAEAGNQNQPTTQPPIKVTVAAPEPSPDAAQREEQYRQREVAAAEDVRDFTRWLTYLTFVQAFLGLGGLVAALVAARAAQRSAKSAQASADALKVINRQWLNFENWTAEVVKGIGPGTNERWHAVDIRVQVRNKTRLPLKLRLLHEMGAEENWRDLHVLAPDEPLEWRFLKRLSDSEIAAYYGRGVSVGTSGIGHFIDNFGEAQKQPFSAAFFICYGEMTRHHVGMFLPYERLPKPDTEAQDQHRA